MSQEGIPSERERREYLQRQLKRAKEARDGLIREVKVLEQQLKESQQTEAELKRRKAIISRAIEDLELGES